MDLYIREVGGKLRRAVIFLIDGSETRGIIKRLNMGDDGMDYNIVFPEPEISGKSG